MKKYFKNVLFHNFCILLILILTFKLQVAVEIQVVQNLIFNSKF